ncbi:MAG: DUF4332 domain-containing protein [Verrucomicrobiota bacterium]
MTRLSSITQINSLSLELLEAAGFLDLDSLARVNAAKLIQELEKANKVLRITDSFPTDQDINEWIAVARERIGFTMEEPVLVDAVPSEALFAIPIPVRLLVDKKVSIDDIPQGVPLDQAMGDASIKGADLVLPKNISGQTGPLNHVKIGDITSPRPEIDNSRIKSMPTLSDPSHSTIHADRIALICAPLKETNLGRNPKSRRYIRGVLHSHPLRIGISAWVTLSLYLLVPSAFVSALLLLLSTQAPKYFFWVPKSILVFPASLPIFGIAYLIWGLGSNCRICSQKLFIHRTCLKNSKAHHRAGLGYILPLCIHIILFKWFRCTYCGTPVRLKK